MGLCVRPFVGHKRQTFVKSVSRVIVIHAVLDPAEIWINFIVFGKESQDDGLCLKSGGSSDG